MAKSSKLRSYDLECSGSMFRDFQISELRTLSNNVTPLILRKNFISGSCTCDRILSVNT